MEQIELTESILFSFFNDMSFSRRDNPLGLRAIPISVPPESPGLGRRIPNSWESTNDPDLMK
ncbi:unnamed protein product [Haemonchus placei]|uniref:Uncharacterized protein n=1 Tax=Haemonchus placei TaxID=6290 RepID=A0A0N4X813_HAEPC|nr:unnamed protein product [Haemonchus placei]